MDTMKQAGIIRKLFSKKGCPEEWVLQAYLDGELKKDKLENTNSHLQSCTNCKHKIEVRKKKIQSVLTAIDENTNYHFIDGKNSKEKKLLHFISWGSVAASILVVLWLFSNINTSINNNAVATDQNCQWIEIEDDNFFPEFISPNRLYQMKVIETEKVSEEGDYTRTFITKICKEQSISN